MSLRIFKNVRLCAISRINHFWCRSLRKFNDYLIGNVSLFGSYSSETFTIKIMTWNITRLYAFELNKQYIFAQIFVADIWHFPRTYLTCLSFIIGFDSVLSFLRDVYLCCRSNRYFIWQQLFIIIRTDPIKLKKIKNAQISHFYVHLTRSYKCWKQTIQICIVIVFLTFSLHAKFK